jgi:predicted nucleic acid-binding protein
VDANVLLRYLVGDQERQAAPARALLQAVEREEAVLLCDPVTLAEVVWVLSSFYELTNAAISEALLPVVQAPGFLLSDKPRYLRALQLYATTVRHFGDACACAAALEDCGGRLYSFDRKLSRVPGVERVEAL